MEYKHTFTGTFKLDESDRKQLGQLSVSKEIVIVERQNGFMEIHSETGVEYTTEDIMSKGL
jgi:hypothetical protein